jgi:hypothetical protein
MPIPGGVQDGGDKTCLASMRGYHTSRGAGTGKIKPISDEMDLTY